MESEVKLPEVPEIGALPKATQDKIKSALEKWGAKRAAELAEKSFGERDRLREERHSLKMGSLRAQLEYQDRAKKQPLFGALAVQCHLVGKEARSLTGKAAEIAERLEKAVGPVAKSVNIADAAEGGIHIEGTVLELFLEPARAASVVFSLNPETRPVTGDQFKVTGFDTDPTLVWVDEENTAPLASTPGSAERQSGMRKALALIPVTQDFRDAASPAVLQAIENGMRNAFRVGFDLRLITGSGNGGTIKGLRNWITTTSAQTGTTLATILDDFSTAMTSIESSNRMAERLGLIFSPRTKNHLMFRARDANTQPFFLEEMRTGTMLGLPFRATTNIPTNLGGGGNESYWIMQAFNHFFVGTSTTLDIQWYENASYSDGGALVSTIERDTNVLRGKQKIGTLMPHTDTGYVLTGVTY